MVQFGLIRHRNKVYQLSEISIRVFLLFLFVGKSNLQTVYLLYLSSLQHFAFRTRNMDSVYKENSPRGDLAL